MLWFRDRSRFSNLWIYLNISVSEWILLKIECCKVTPSLVVWNSGLIFFDGESVVNRLAISSISVLEVFSSNEIPTKPSLWYLKLNSLSKALRSKVFSSRLFSLIDKVSKYDSLFNMISCPWALNFSARFLVWAWIVVAISFNFSGPWKIAYILEIIASNTWAVQIFEVAFSLLICCSLVCNVNL